jgi:hypothetical protein
VSENLFEFLLGAPVVAGEVEVEDQLLRTQLERTSTSRSPGGTGTTPLIKSSYTCRTAAEQRRSRVRGAESYRPRLTLGAAAPISPRTDVVRVVELRVRPEPPIRGRAGAPLERCSTR